MFGALAKFLSIKPELKPGVVLRFFVDIPPAETGENSAVGNSAARVRGRALAALVMKENAERKSYELLYGFSLWQEMDVGCLGL